MSKLKITANVVGKSNAVLTNMDDNIIAIITCKKNENITKKVCLAIKEDSVSDTVRLNDVDDSGVLTNQTPLFFSAGINEEFGEMIVNFKLEIHTTY